MIIYATTADIQAMGRTLTAAQNEAAGNLLETASAKQRVIARKYGKDIDSLISDGDYAAVVKSIVIQSVLRAVTSMEEASPAATQISQSGLGYSASMTYLNAGQNLYFLRNELKELGIMRQTWGAMEVY